MCLKKKLQKFSLAIILSTYVLHGFNAYAGTESGVGKITKLYAPSSGDFIRIEFSKVIENPDNCGLSNFYIVETTSSQQDSFVSLLYSAFFANKDVYFWVEGCSTITPWGFSHPLVTDVYVQ